MPELDRQGMSRRMNELVALGGHSVQATADLLGCHRTLLHRWMSGVKVPEVKYLAAMVELGWSVDWLLAGKGSPLLSGKADVNYQAGVRVGLTKVAMMVREAAAGPESTSAAEGGAIPLEGKKAAGAIAAARKAAAAKPPAAAGKKGSRRPHVSEG